MTGIAELPLHEGRVPYWMLRVMERMASAIVKALVEVRGPESIVDGLSDPIWFQAFNNVIGMDWDSSGSTTVVMAVLKKISWNEDLGFMVLGGKGSRMRLVPEEAHEAAERLGVDQPTLERFSRAAARIDTSLLQDGYDLYIHTLVATSGGRLLVVQQGMNPGTGLARRYHLGELSVEEPHSGIAGVPGDAINVIAPESGEARKLYLDLISEGSRRLKRSILEANRILKGSPTILDWIGGGRETGMPRGRQPPLKPYYRPVRVDPQFERALKELESKPPASEEDLLWAKGVTPKVVRALALVADLIYSVPTSTKDPVTAPLNPFAYSYAVGGKDGVPYRLDRRTAEKVAVTLEEAVNLARLGDKERMRALERLRRSLRAYLAGFQA